MVLSVARYPFAFLFLFILGDAVFTYFYPGYVLSKKPYGPPLPKSQVHISHPVYHHGLKPLFSGWDYQWDNAYAYFTTNSLGMRDRTTREVSLSSGGHRILFIGDSFTEGFGIPFEKTWFALVEKALAKEGIDSLNAGVGSYSPIIYFTKTKHLVEKERLKFNELVVFLDLSDIQDETLYEIQPDQSISLRPEYLRLWGPGSYDSFLGNLLAHYTTVPYGLSYQWNLWRIGFNAGLNKKYAVYSKRSHWTVSPHYWKEFGEKGMEKAQASMTQLKNYLDALGIPLTVVVYPWPDQVYFSDTNSVQVLRWREWSELHSAKFIDLFPEFQMEHFLPGDCHWNAAGNQRAADGFLKRFKTPLKRNL